MTFLLLAILIEHWHLPLWLYPLAAVLYAAEWRVAVRLLNRD